VGEAPSRDRRPMKQKKSGDEHPRKAILSANLSLTRELLSIGDERWSRIRAHIPKTLTAEEDNQLRKAILTCCSAYLTHRSRLQEGAATAAAVRRIGGKQPAPLERLAKHLRMAAKAWSEISRMHDDRRGILGDYGNHLAAMADDAERRLKGIRDLGAPTILINPWSGFVLGVAECCRKADLKPTASGDIYQNASPSWFQKLVFAINENLLGIEGGTRHGKAAFYAEIAKALHSDRKPGKARK
jgi:hypothetical protein